MIARTANRIPVITAATESDEGSVGVCTVGMGGVGDGEDIEKAESLKCRCTNRDTSDWKSRKKVRFEHEPRTDRQPVCHIYHVRQLQRFRL